MPLGTVKDLMVGETVVAIGNAYGYEHTVTVGVVSALKRDVTLNKEVQYKSLIQTDASINPGNSGGPLLNINGEMIGVNVAIRAGAQGISFAIPVDTMIQVVGDMLATRIHRQATHGLVCRNELEPAAGANAEGLTRSLVVERAEASGPAAQAGLQAGDVIVRVASTPVCCSMDLERAVLDYAAGDRVPVTVRRQGLEKRVELVLQAAADQDGPSNAELIWNKLGLRLTPVHGELVSRTDQRFQGGLAVIEVKPDGAAAKAGIVRGDVLIGLHQWKTLSLDNVAFVLTHKDLATFNPLAFYIIRANQVHRGFLPQVD
jgi:serine protease Do